MSDETAIEWTDATWNPVRGCTRVSEGCRNCYAERVAYRFSGEGQPYEGLVRIGADGKRRPEWSGAIQFVEQRLLDPLRWGPVVLHTQLCVCEWELELRCWKEDRKGKRPKRRCACSARPRRIFVNSMSDLFHEGVTDEMLDRIFAVMALCPQHTFQVLTKRPERMLEYLSASPSLLLGRWTAAMSGEMLKRTTLESGDTIGTSSARPNMWLGVSVEEAKWKSRIDILRGVPAGKRFLSLEPLLGDLGELDLTGIDWVIAGGESGKGPGIRPSHPDWFRSVRDQCAAAGVPFFFKQHGERIAINDYDPFVHGFDSGKYEHQFVYRTGTKNDQELPSSTFRVGKKAAGDLLDRKQHHAFPEVQRGR